jgi:hypothetical protein
VTRAGGVKDHSGQRASIDASMALGMTHLLKIKEINLMLARNDWLTPQRLGAAVLRTVHFGSQLDQTKYAGQSGVGVGLGWEGGRQVIGTGPLAVGLGDGAGFRKRVYVAAMSTPVNRPVAHEKTARRTAP